MAVTIPKGTKEYLVVEVTDALAGIASLSGLNPRYTVEDPAEVELYSDAAATPVGMKAKCMIDTTTGSWPIGDYKLWLRFDASPEIPLIGPFEFTVDDGP